MKDIEDTNQHFSFAVQLATVKNSKIPESAETAVREILMKTAFETCKQIVRS
jgi:hypothetical protein